MWKVRAHLSNGKVDYPFMDEGPTFNSILQAANHAGSIAKVCGIRTDVCEVQSDGSFLVVTTFHGHFGSED